MQNAHDPPGFIAPAKWAAAGRPFELPERSVVSQDWLTAEGRLRTDLEGSRDVQVYEAGASKMAMGQIMSVGQTVFYLWMVGGQLSLFSIMFLLQGGTAPVYALMRLNEGASTCARARAWLCSAQGAALCTPPCTLRDMPPSFFLCAVRGPAPLPPSFSHAHESTQPPARAAFAGFAVVGAKLGSAKAIYVAINLVGCGIVLWKLRSIGLLPLTSADWVSLLPPKRFVEFSGASF